MLRLGLLLAILTAQLAAIAAPTLSLDSCQALAQANYPLLKRYDIVARTTAVELSDINKSWLPQVSVYAQGTLQNSVPEFPDALRNVLSQMQQNMKGLGKLQYKAGVDLTQPIFDGGESKASRRVARSRREAARSQLDVEMYALRERVQSLYFGILLMEEQIAQTECTVRLLDANIKCLKAMLANGAAMQSDVDMLEAQRLTIRQQLTAARGNEREYRSLLGIYIGRSVEDAALERPAGTMPADTESQRPELAAFAARERLNLSRREAVGASLMPRIGLFAQAWGGYPGMDYFKSMISRRMSMNLMAGVKVSWSISPVYTRSNRLRSISLDNESVANDREVFLFNSRLQSAAEMERISTMREQMADDARIVELAGNVRKAAEAQLSNGIIDTTALLTKITDENRACLTARYHEIQLLQLIYQLKNTLNR